FARKCFRREEGFEDAWHVFRGDATPKIANRYRKILRRSARHEYQFLWQLLQLSCADNDLLSVIHGFCRIQDEIQKDLLDKIFGCLNLRQVLSWVKLHLDFPEEPISQ